LSANAWHTAADWVEAFAPVLRQDLEPRLLAEEAAARAANDELLTAGNPMRHPVVCAVAASPLPGRDDPGGLGSVVGPA